MYSILPSFVLGFHGCDRSVAEAVLAGRTHLRQSSNQYDWLGEGVYFWENSPTRAMEYATLLSNQRRKSGPKIKAPAVIGAILDLGYCLNLLDAKFLRTVQYGFASLTEFCRATGVPLPTNKPVGIRRDLLLRDLDCAVVNTVHQTRRQQGLTRFDTVRAAFIEGEPLYPGSGFSDRNHIQICVRNHRCIKGYFRPLEDPDSVIGANS